MATTKKPAAKKKAAATKTSTKRKTAAKAAPKTVKATTSAAKKIKKPVAKKSLKKTTKKTTKKASKKTTPSAPARVLVCAADAKCFWVSDGQVVRDLVELRDALKTMTDDVFAYHAGGEQNDFAAWIEHVLSDAECAAALIRVRTRRGAQTVITKQLKLYTL